MPICRYSAKYTLWELNQNEYIEFCALASLYLLAAETLPCINDNI